jgi:hypothetical protein
MSGWLSWASWSTAEGLSGQQQVMVQIPKKMGNDQSVVNIENIEKNLKDVYRITIQSLDLILEQDQTMSQLLEQSEQLAMLSKQFADNEKILAKNVEGNAFTKKVSRFVDRVQMISQDFKKEQLHGKVQEDSRRLEQLRIQAADIPPVDPNDKTGVIVDEDVLLAHLRDIQTFYSNELIPLLESRGVTLVDLMEMSEQLLIASEQFRKDARNLNVMLTGAGNVYWIFLVDIISSLLSLINTTRETKLAVITANSGRLLLSFAVLISVIMGRLTNVQTGLVFGTAYILLTWLFSVINTIIETYKTLRDRGTLQLVYFVLTVLYTLYITYFGVKTYVTSKALFKGSVGAHRISGGYLAGIGMFGIVLSALKLYITWYGSVPVSPDTVVKDISDVPLTNITDEAVSHIEVESESIPLPLPSSETAPEPEDEDDSDVVEPEEEMEL